MKMIKRILAGMLGTVLVLGLLAAALGLSGDPLSRAWAEKRAVAYAQELYPGQVFFVQAVARDRPFSYRAEVQSRESGDTHFSVITDFWVSTSSAGDHIRMVESKWNTKYRLGEEAAERAAAILMVELPEMRFSAVYGTEERIAFVEMEGEADGLTLDMPFDASLMNEYEFSLSAVVLCKDDPTEAELREALNRIRAAMEKHGMMFARYDITLIRSDGEGEALNSEMISAEEMGE